MGEPTAISASAPNTGAAAPPSNRKVKALYRDLKLAVEYVPIESLRAYKRALRTHSPAHIEQLEASIQAGILIALPIPFGNTLPGFAVILMGLGLALGDGLVILGALILAALATGTSAVLG